MDFGVTWLRALLGGKVRVCLMIPQGKLSFWERGTTVSPLPSPFRRHMDYRDLAGSFWDGGGGSWELICGPRILGTGGSCEESKAGGRVCRPVGQGALGPQQDLYSRIFSGPHRPILC